MRAYWLAVPPGQQGLRRLRPDKHVVEEAAAADGGEERKGDEKHELDVRQWNHLLSLEPEVLERFRSAPVEPRGLLVLTTPRRQIALRDPR